MFALQIKNIILWAQTLSHKPNEAFGKGHTEYSVHLGLGVYLTITQYQKEKYYEVRRCWKPADLYDEDAPPATLKECCQLNESEFQKFIQLVPGIYEKFPYLSKHTPCQCLSGGCCHVQCGIPL